jgi:hypothetical protein
VHTAAVDELFVALDAVMQSYRSLPDNERDDRLNTDAVLITGEIAPPRRGPGADLGRPWAVRAGLLSVVSGFGRSVPATFVARSRWRW